MRTSPAAVTALVGSLLLPLLMLGSAQALTSAPDLKNVMSTTRIGTVTPVRAGGGGGFVGGGGHMGGMGGGHMGGMGGRMGGFAGRVHGGPTFAGRGFMVTSITDTSAMTVASITDTSSMTVALITVASSTIASLSPVVPGGAGTTIPVGGGQVGDGSGLVTERKEAGVRKTL